MPRNLGIEGTAVEDGPRLGGHSVALGSVADPGWQRSRSMRQTSISSGSRSRRCPAANRRAIAMGILTAHYRHFCHSPAQVLFGVNPSALQVSAIASMWSTVVFGSAFALTASRRRSALLPLEPSRSAVEISESMRAPSSPFPRAATVTTTESTAWHVRETSRGAADWGPLHAASPRLAKSADKARTAFPTSLPRLVEPVTWYSSAHLADP